MNRGKENCSRQPFERKAIFLMLLAFAGLMCFCSPLLAQQPEAAVPKQPSFLSVREFLAAGGAIGYVIMFLSFLMVALMADAAISLRRTVFMPPGLAEEVHRLLAERKPQEARSLCMNHPGFLSQVLAAGLDECSSMAWPPIEKAMEDAAGDQAARVSRRIEYLSVISTLAPMLGLMGTVWGMIVAFMEFELKANPQISELAPGIYKALVTTLQGLGVAIPCIGGLAFFRSRIEDLATESTLLAAHVFADFRRTLQSRRAARAKDSPVAK